MMQKRIDLKLVVLGLLSLLVSSSSQADDAFTQPDPEAKCDFIGYLAYEIALYRDAGIDSLSTLTSLERKYIDNQKISNLVPFYVRRLYTDKTLHADNVHDVIKHRCLLQFKALYSQHRY